MASIGNRASPASSKLLAAHVTDSVSRLAGGMFESVRGLTRGIDTVEGWRATTFSMHDSQTSEDLTDWKGLDVVLSPRSRFVPLVGARAISQQVLAARPTIVHIHGVWGPGSVAGMGVVRGNDLASRTVVSPRGMLDAWALAHSRAKKALAWRLWTRNIIMRAGCLHALCEPEARSIATVAPGRPICVIPNGVELPQLIDDNAALRDRSILFLGRIHPKKGLAELLGGWAKSGLANRGWKLDIAGWDDGGHILGLKAQAASLDISESVRFLGPAFGKRKEELFRRASAFILPSFSEGLPMAVLEAWSYSVPVIISDACNLAKGFDAGAAIRCAPEPESIAVALHSITTGADAHVRLDIGASGRRLVEGTFSWAQIARQTVEVYAWLSQGADKFDTPSSIVNND